DLRRNQQSLVSEVRKSAFVPNSEDWDNYDDSLRFFTKDEITSMTASRQSQNTTALASPLSPSLNVTRSSVVQESKPVAQKVEANESGYQSRVSGSTNEKNVKAHAIGPQNETLGLSTDDEIE
ncbi:unnamed protein product, partial [Didymodactylos carnosus]